MRDVAVLLFCRLLIALVFGFSALGKARDLAGFQTALGGFRLLPQRLVAVTARVIVAAECLIVLLVASPAWPVGGFLLALVLLGVFSIALLLALRRKVKISCSCFGRSEQAISGYDLLRNGLLGAASLLGVLKASAGDPVSQAELALVALMAATGATSITNLADILETLRHPIRIR